MTQEDSHPNTVLRLYRLFQELFLFDRADGGLVRRVGAELEWFSLPGGWTLFEEGAEANALYIVTSGSLGVFVSDGADGSRLIARLGVGETVGEMAMISGSPRSASIRALRDTSLLRLGKPGFDRLMAEHPAAMMPIARQLVERLQRLTVVKDHPPAPGTIALLPLTPSVPIAELARSLSETLSADGQRVHLLDASAAVHTEDWFHAIESAHDLILYRADCDATAWSRLCLRQADRVVLLADADEAPPPELAAAELLDRAGLPAAELVLLQESETGMPRAGQAWLDRYGPTCRCQLRRGHGGDLARLARLLSNKAVGLVLSGGGARGFGHIGVVKALREYGVTFDFVGGASMGAIIAAGLAFQWDDDELRARMHAAFVASDPLNDYTLPLVALIKGGKATRRLRTHFGETLIEDLWLPYFCLSSDLTAGSARVHRTGPLWRALRASIAIPGVLPPVVDAGTVLVDGAVMNALPADVMNEMMHGTIIGVDVAADWSVSAEIDSFETGMLRNLMNLRRGHAPGIVSLLMRAATVSSSAQTRDSRAHVDLLIEPPLDDIGIRDWGTFDAAIETGYRHTMEVLERERPALPTA